MKKSQTDNENDKNPKIFQFSKIYAFFVNASTVFEDWSNLKGQVGMGWWSSCLVRRDYSIFPNEIDSN